jgi:hypothetical protein
MMNIKTLFTFLMLASLQGIRCNNAGNPAPGSGPGLYYILEKMHANERLVITRQCGLYNYLTYNDTLVEIGYHLGGAFRYKINRQSLQGHERTIFCKGEYEGNEYLDTTVSVTLRLKDYNTKSLQAVMRREGDFIKEDTFFITPASFIDKFKLVELECSKKAQ